MKSWLYYALAAALIAAPIGWLAAGFLKAVENPVLSSQLHRPLYVTGEYDGAATLAAVFAFASTLLIGKGRCSTLSSAQK
jgi:hypothetical protein